MKLRLLLLGMLMSLIFLVQTLTASAAASPDRFRKLSSSNSAQPDRFRKLDAPERFRKLRLARALAR